MRLFVALAVFTLGACGQAGAQTLDLTQIIPAEDPTFTGRIIQGIVLLTVLSVAPGLLVTATSFTRFVVAFAFLRTGLGLQSTPSNIIIVALSLFMTFFVMSPVFERAWSDGVEPLIEREIDETEAIPRIVQPFREFMSAQVRNKDLELFEAFAARVGDGEVDKANPELQVLVPAFMISELRRGFEIGFLILLPFLVIDLVVATITMAMGMMMLPPTVISLPFKVLFFVLIDGWNVITDGLLESVI